MMHQGKKGLNSGDTLWVALVLGNPYKARISIFPQQPPRLLPFYLKTKYPPIEGFYRFLRRTQKRIRYQG